MNEGQEESRERSQDDVQVSDLGVEGGGGGGAIKIAWVESGHVDIEVLIDDNLNLVKRDLGWAGKTDSSVIIVQVTVQAWE